MGREKENLLSTCHQHHSVYSDPDVITLSSFRVTPSGSLSSSGAAKNGGGKTAGTIVLIEMGRGQQETATLCESLGLKVLIFSTDNNSNNNTKEVNI